MTKYSRSHEHVSIQAIWTSDPINQIKKFLTVLYLALIGCMFISERGLADESIAATPQRFTVEGNRLIFNSSVEGKDGYDGIDYQDAATLRQLLRDYPEIRILELSSDGGVHPAALDIAAVVADYGIDTVVHDRCESACTLIFLAGDKRTLGRGARLGFHSASWSRDNLKDYYEITQDARGWIDEFAFASWVYEEGMRDFNKILEYMIARGVDVQFIIRAAYVNHDDIWYPTREELEKYGLINPLE